MILFCLVPHPHGDHSLFAHSHSAGIPLGVISLPQLGHATQKSSCPAEKWPEPLLQNQMLQINDFPRRITGKHWLKKCMLSPCPGVCCTWKNCMESLCGPFQAGTRPWDCGNGELWVWNQLIMGQTSGSTITDISARLHAGSGFTRDWLWLTYLLWDGLYF